MGLSDKLKQLITEDKLNTTRIAEKSGVDRRTIHSIIKKENLNPRIDTVKKLAYYFGITIDELIR